MFRHPIYTSLGQVTVRPIDPSDADKAEAFLASLSGTSRYFRFFQPLKRLSPSMLERFTCIDHRTQVALVGLALVQGKHGIVGEARYCVNDDGATAEIAVVVADEWQRRGVATGLLTTLERIAAANGITRFTGETFAINEAFRSFVRASGFEIRRDSDPAYMRFEKHIGVDVSSSGCGDFIVW